jgi:U3 small nucleolar RNA-associated protein 10
MDDQGLGLKIVQKPAGRKTTYWLRTSIFSLFPLIPRPTGVVLDWFADPSSVCLRLLRTFVAN